MCCPYCVYCVYCVCSTVCAVLSYLHFRQPVDFLTGTTTLSSADGGNGRSLLGVFALRVGVVVDCLRRIHIRLTQSTTTPQHRPCETHSTKYQQNTAQNTKEKGVVSRLSLTVLVSPRLSLVRSRRVGSVQPVQPSALPRHMQNPPPIWWRALSSTRCPTSTHPCKRFSVTPGSSL